MVEPKNGIRSHFILDSEQSLFRSGIGISITDIQNLTH